MKQYSLTISESVDWLPLKVKKKPSKVWRNRNPPRTSCKSFWWLVPSVFVCRMRTYKINDSGKVSNVLSTLPMFIVLKTGLRRKLHRDSIGQDNHDRVGYK